MSPLVATRSQQLGYSKEINLVHKKSIYLGLIWGQLSVKEISKDPPKIKSIHNWHNFVKGK